MNKPLPSSLFLIVSTRTWVIFAGLLLSAVPARAHFQA